MKVTIAKIFFVFFSLIGVIILLGVLSSIYHDLFDSEDLKILKELRKYSQREVKEYKDIASGSYNMRMTREEEENQKKERAEREEFKKKYIGYRIKNLDCEYRGMKQEEVSEIIHCYPGVDGVSEDDGGTVWMGVKIDRENSRQIGAVYPGDKFKIWGTISQVEYSSINLRNGKSRFDEAEVVLSNGWVKTSKMPEPPVNIVSPNKNQAQTPAPGAVPATVISPKPSDEVSSYESKIKQGFNKLMLVWNVKDWAECAASANFIKGEIMKDESASYEKKSAAIDMAKMLEALGQHLINNGAVAQNISQELKYWGDFFNENGRDVAGKSFEKCMPVFTDAFRGL